ncbi:MAG: response regulator [Magnetococcales bacterium]|nr:response regulator [Magnetococcales bacterium]
MQNLLQQMAAVTRDALVVIDGQDRILLWNAGAEAMFGYRSEESLGQPIGRLMPERYRQRHQQALQRIQQAQPAHYTGKTLSLYGLHRDGREIPIEASLSGWREGGETFFSAIIRDISERLALEERNEKVYQSQIAISNLLQIAIRPLALPELLQEALQTILAIPWLSLESRGAIFLLDESREWLLLTAQQNLPEEIRATCARVPVGECLCGQAALTQRVTFVERVDVQRQRCNTGVLNHGHYNIPILFNERLLGVIMAYVPPDHRSVQEEEQFLTSIAHTLAGVIERKEGERRLHDAKEAAELASRYKSEFLATISHEVRTPLNGIMGMAALLMEQRLSSKKLFYVEMIRKSGENLLNIINDVLDLSKIESGHLELEESPFLLREVRNELRDLFGELATKKGLHLRTRIATDVPLLVQGDVHRIRQILVNLLSNAIKFTEKGEITLRVGLARPPGDAVACDPTVAWIEFQVEDTGIGIPADVAQRLFQPFTQGDASTTRKYGGSGLGLAICRRLAERMHGSISLASTEGKGSLFTFLVPLKISTDLHKADTVAKPSKIHLPKDLHILVAEDNVVNQKLLHIMLKSAGIRVTTAEDGVVALRLLQGGRYDLVLMDCHMPEMDGLAACRALRRYEREQQRPRTPVVAVTANAMPGERERCLEAGMDDFLTKPLDKGDLYALLVRHLAPGKQGPPSDKETEWAGRSEEQPDAPV